MPDDIKLVSFFAVYLVSCDSNWQGVLFSGRGGGYLLAVTVLLRNDTCNARRERRISYRPRRVRKRQSVASDAGV